MTKLRVGNPTHDYRLEPDMDVDVEFKSDKFTVKTGIQDTTIKYANVTQVEAQSIFEKDKKPIYILKIYVGQGIYAFYYKDKNKVKRYTSAIREYWNVEKNNK